MTHSKPSLPRFLNKLITLSRASKSRCRLAKAGGMRALTEEVEEEAEEEEEEEAEEEEEEEEGLEGPSLAPSGGIEVWRVGDVIVDAASRGGRRAGAHPSALPEVGTVESKFKSSASRTPLPRFRADRDWDIFTVKWSP